MRLNRKRQDTLEGSQNLFLNLHPNENGPSSLFSILLNPAVCPRRLTCSGYINITPCHWHLSDSASGKQGQETRSKKRVRTGDLSPGGPPLWAGVGCVPPLSIPVPVRQPSPHRSLSGLSLPLLSLAPSSLAVTTGIHTGIGAHAILVAFPKPYPLPC